MRRLLEAAGAEVTAEYYINDAGAQMEKFGASVLARAAGRSTPEDGYPGAYVADRAAEVLEQRPDLLDLDPAEGLEVARDLGYVAQLAAIKRTLDGFGVHFDVWFSERSLHDGRAVEQAVDRLREQGHVFDDEGAVWLRTTDFGDDRDRVLIRADGEPPPTSPPTPPTTCQQEGPRLRREGLPPRSRPPRLHQPAQGDRRLRRRRPRAQHRGPDRPAGQPRGRAAGQAGRQHRSSMRRPDQLDRHRLPIRYSLARYPADSPLSLDGEELRKQTNDNPVFYVQYAHARTSNVARLAAEDGVDRADGFDPSLLSDPTEAALARHPRRLPAGRGPGGPPASSRTASRATSRTSPATSTSGTTPAGCAR